MSTRAEIADAQVVVQSLRTDAGYCSNSIHTCLCCMPSSYPPQRL